MSLNERARGLRRNSTDAERALWRLLRRGGIDGHKFRRQQPIGPFIVDFIRLELHLVVEVDGGQHAAEPETDAARDEWLRANGYRILRFWNDEVLVHPEAVGEVILRACGQSPSP